jgi:hypothetical protein
MQLSHGSQDTKCVVLLASNGFPPIVIRVVLLLIIPGGTLNMINREPFKGMNRGNIREHLEILKNRFFVLYGIWEALVACKTRGVGTISTSKTQF